MPSCTLNPASEEVADFIYRFGSLQNNLRDPEQFPCVDYVSNDYAIFYTPLNEALPVSLERYPYYSIPGLFTLLDDSAMKLPVFWQLYRHQLFLIWAKAFSSAS